MRGHDGRAELLIKDTVNEASARDLGATLTMMQVARAVICNGRGRYEEALAAAQEAATDPLELGPTKWALAELVEAGVRGGHTDVAVTAFGQLSAMVRASGTDLALGIEAGRCALLREDDAAEQPLPGGDPRDSAVPGWASSARGRGSSTANGCAGEVAASTPGPSRNPPTTHSAPMGVEAFAKRAWHELPGHRGDGPQAHGGDCTRNWPPKEAHIARRAADGLLTNPEIAARAVPQPADRRVAPPQGLHQGRRDHAPAAAALVTRPSLTTKGGSRLRRSAGAQFRGVSRWSGAWRRWAGRAAARRASSGCQPAQRCALVLREHARQELCGPSYWASFGTPVKPSM